MLEDSIDFYPTPSEIADELVDGMLNKYGQGTILEPSAGSGNLCKALERASSKMNRYNNVNCYINCIEISANLRAILKDNGYNVVHDDFLTFKPHTYYDGIVMNPPFSLGAKHLLKALEIMQDGGKVHCILNAETLRNPYTNERKYLVQQLSKYNAEIKYMQNAFLDAERKTDIEIAVVKVDIPKPSKESRIYIELQREKEVRDNESPEYYALVNADPIKAAIERYNMAADGIKKLYDEFNAIAPFIGTCYEGDNHPTTIMSISVDYHTAIHNLRGMYWRKLFELPQIRNSLTNTMLSDYNKRLKELEEYEFSMYNISAIRQEIAANLVSGIKSELIKLFDNWTNLHYNKEYSKNIHYFNGWCTNNAYKVCDKVIFHCNAFDCWDNKFRHYQVEDNLRNIERVLHFLDTNGQDYNADELRQILIQAEKDDNYHKIPFKYFTATFYKKGTCHIEFTNKDILKSFNAFACQHKGWLPPSYGKKYYDDMDSPEKDIVNSFEGKDSYDDSVVRNLIPTQNSLLQLAM